jgi:hypothetical protein
MPNRAAPALMLREGDREELSRLTRSSSVRAGLAQRARIVLLAADGVSNTAIAEMVGVSRPTVISWRDRYLARGMDGLDDRPRSGRPRTIDHSEIVAATLSPPPKKLGATHWSTRLLAKHLGISAPEVIPPFITKSHSITGVAGSARRRARLCWSSSTSYLNEVDRSGMTLPLPFG